MDNDTITAADLRIGTRVRDNFTPWAEVIKLAPRHLRTDHTVTVVWRLADGQVEVDTYEPAAEFTPLPSPATTTPHR